MSSDKEIEKFYNLFPSLAKELDQVSLAEAVRDMIEYESMEMETKDTNHFLDNILYSRLESKFLDAISLITKIYGVSYDKDGRKRWLKPKSSDQFGIRLFLMGEGFELQPKYILAPGEEMPIYFPEFATDRPAQYKNFVNLRYGFLQTGAHDKFESVVNAISVAKSEISEYPSGRISVDESNDGIREPRYKIGDYGIYGYMLGHGFRILNTRDVINKNGSLVRRAW
jgi:hypothetical protein